MKKLVRRSHWNRLRQSWRLANDRKACCLANLGPFDAAWRFSTRFGWVSRGPQSRQQCVQPASHLLRGTRTPLVFPRAKLGLDQITCQNQMIVGNGDQVAPTLKLFGGAHTRLVPKQRLFLKTIAMLLAEAQSITQGNRDQIGLLIPNPDHPAHARVPLSVGRMRAHDLDHRHLQPPSVFDMHLLPPRELDGSGRSILTLPGAIRVAMRRGILWLPFVPILARCPWFAGGWG